MPPVVCLVGAEDKVAFGAGDGDVEEAFFLFDVSGLLGVVAGEFVFGHSGDEDGVEFEAFGLVDGEDGDGGVVVGEEVEVAREGGVDIAVVPGAGGSGKGFHGGGKVFVMERNGRGFQLPRAGLPIRVSSWLKLRGEKFLPILDWIGALKMSGLGESQTWFPS